jgi:ankyrin repeat protein
MERFATVENVLDAVREAAVEFGNFETRPEVNSKGFFGNVPLIIAITWGNKDAVELLLNAGAEIDVACEGGNTPLHEAIQAGEFEIARLLVARGADQEARNTEGKKPRDLCWEGEWAGIFGVRNDA